LFAAGLLFVSVDAPQAESRQANAAAQTAESAILVNFIYFLFSPEL